jgi:GDP-L-fucose synthase
VAETHLGIGTAKRDMAIVAEMYHREYGLDAVSVLSANAYGPGDRFDPEVSHVIPATIIKCHRNEPLVVWGDGKATRDFIFVDDLAEGILRAAERLSAPNYYVNLSGNCEVSIADLVHLIAKLCDFKNQIVFDSSKPGGDLRRAANGQLARQLLSFEPATDLQTGMRQTIAAYRNNSAVAKS